MGKPGKEMGSGGDERELSHVSDTKKATGLMLTRSGGLDSMEYPGKA